MARVVQRRSNPTVVYVLVAFVILFLISTVLAVMQYMEASDLAKQVDEQEQTLDKLATGNDLKKPKVAAIMKAADGKTVVEKLLTQIETLSSRLNANFSTYQEAQTAWNELREKEQQENLDLTANRGLLPLVKALRGRLDVSTDEEGKLATQLRNCRQEVQQKEDALASLKQQHAEKVTQLSETIAQINTRLDERETAHGKLLAKARDESEAIQKDLRGRIEELSDKIDELQISLNLERDKVNKLRNEIRDIKAPKTVTPEGEVVEAAPDMAVAQKPDGKILKVIEADDVCYINLGSRDDVAVGLTFTVYPSSGIPADGEGKAKVIVKNVDKYSAECQIVSQEKGKPVLQGDLIGNVAFGTMQQYTFVVKGQFDLFGQGTPSAENAKIVKNLIKRFGGNLSDELSIQTDFLVLGAEPDRPEKPKEGTEDQGVYQQQLKEYMQFQNLKDEARRLGIPVLNTSRFLSFTGYTPQKTLKY